MYKYIIVFVIVECIGLLSYGQQKQKVRYKDIEFDQITIQKNVTYYKSQPGIKTKYYKADVYEPYNDTCLKRPLIIWMHGGGFKFGNKRSGGIPVWSRTFAARGYVCAAINYRLNKQKPLKDYKALVKQCMMAIEDVTHAVDFFKINNEVYHIDTNRIILAGNSAGGMIALQAVYSSFSELAQRVSNNDSIDYSSVHNPMHIKAVASFWGALFDIKWLKNAKVPIVSVHGKRDRVVSITTTDSLFFGSSSIHQQADILGIQNDIKIYDGYAHELQRFFQPVWFGNGVRERWQEAGDFVADFLYKQLFQK